MRSILIIITAGLVLAGCSNLKYIEMRDTTEEQWTEIQPRKGKTDSVLALLPKVEIQKEKSEIRREKKEDYKTPRAGVPWKIQISEGEINMLPFPILPRELRLTNFPVNPLSGTISIDSMEVDIPARDRRSVAALQLGALIQAPDVGNDSITPMGAFFYRKQWDQDRRRLRAVLSGLVNFVDFAEGTWNDSGWEFCCIGPITPSLWKEMKPLEGMKPNLRK